MTADLDLFGPPAPGPATGPGEAEKPDTGAALDWQLQPERICPVTGKPRPRFWWPVNLPARPRRFHKRDGSTAIKTANRKTEMKEQQQQARPLSSGELLEQNAEEES
ncbi:hypothetical protein FJY70_00270 [candidate division WOR-3 bacterium]|nr:hypothetical protein [candidate division WOR-3 bacterium]